MPITRFICLANSTKLNGRCIAGIEIDKRNKPIFINGIPQWIRPVDKGSGEVDENLVSQINLLDIVEIEIDGRPNILGHQTENYFFKKKSWKKIGSYKNDLHDLCNNDDLIFNNRGKAVSADVIHELGFSLMLIVPETIEITNEGNKLRAHFTYNSINYDLPITDPSFIAEFQNDSTILEGKDQIHLCLSLAVEHNGWYSKLVAGILF